MQTFENWKRNRVAQAQDHGLGHPIYEEKKNRYEGKSEEKIFALYDKLKKMSKEELYSLGYENTIDYKSQNLNEFYKMIYRELIDVIKSISLGEAKSFDKSYLDDGIIYEAIKKMRWELIPAKLDRITQMLSDGNLYNTKVMQNIMDGIWAALREKAQEYIHNL